MNNYIPVYLYGAIIVSGGIFLGLSGNMPYSVVKFILGISLIIGAAIAFIAALSRQRKEVQFAYHEMHALAMLVYGVSILVFCDSFEKLNSFTAFLLFFYTFSEIIFCNWLFNLFQKKILTIIFIRVFLALATGVGVIIAMNSQDWALQIFGTLLVLVGINIIFYVPVMKVNTWSSPSNQTFE